VIWLGVYPKPVLAPIDNSVKALLSFMDEKAITQEAKDLIRLSNTTKGGN
jgi:NADH-quinone oxidoreductase subunit M